MPKSWREWKSPGWKVEGFGTYDIPGFIQFLLKKGILEDLSWHNDADPSFGLAYATNEPIGGRLRALVSRDIRLWVSHPLALGRSPGVGADDNFLVTLVEDDEPIHDSVHTNLESALEALWEQGQEHVPNWTEVALEDLKDEFYGA